jgi:hypothetical protein
MSAASDAPIPVTAPVRPATSDAVKSRRSEPDPGDSRDAGAAAEPPRGLRRWALGLQVGPFDAPQGHVGVPLGGTMEGYHLPAAVVVRVALDAHMALNAGFGLPQSRLGLGIWAGHELFMRVAQDSQAVVALELYEDAGLTLGFTGPDYYARREGVFVGYDYAIGGPLAFGLRLPVGARAVWLEGAIDTYV